MLLGSFVDNYDEDETRLELVESPHGTQESTYNMSYMSQTSPSHDEPFAPPTRTATIATDMSQQTTRPGGPPETSVWASAAPSGRNHYPTYP